MKQVTLTLINSMRISSNKYSLGCWLEREIGGFIVWTLWDSALHFPGRRIESVALMQFTRCIHLWSWSMRDEQLTIDVFKNSYQHRKVLYTYSDHPEIQPNPSTESTFSCTVLHPSMTCYSLPYITIHHTSFLSLGLQTHCPIIHRKDEYTSLKADSTPRPLWKENSAEWNHYSISVSSCLVRMHCICTIMHRVP